LKPSSTPESIYEQWDSTGNISDDVIGFYVPEPGWSVEVALPPHFVSDVGLWTVALNDRNSPLSLQAWLRGKPLTFNKGDKLFVKGRIREVKYNLIVLEDAEIQNSTE